MFDDTFMTTREVIYEILVGYCILATLFSPFCFINPDNSYTRGIFKKAFDFAGIYPIERGTRAYGRLSMES